MSLIILCGICDGPTQYIVPASLPFRALLRGGANIGVIQRTLYLVAYDIAHPRRLARALKTVRAYATGGQKSVHECWLLPGELAALTRELDGVIDHGDDSVLFVRLDPRLKPRILGIARPPADPSFFFVG